MSNSYNNNNGDQEDETFQKFLMKRALDADAPLCKGQMCDEYKEATGSKLSWRALKEHLETILVPNDKNNSESDIEQFAKLYFVCSTPVDDNFLKKLREQSSVTIDSKRRITKFEGKKLKFAGIHSRSARSDRYKRYKRVRAKCSRDFSVESSNSDCSSLSTSSNNSKESSALGLNPSQRRRVDFTSAESIGEFFSQKTNETREGQKNNQAAVSSSLESVATVVTIESDTESGCSEYKNSSRDGEGQESDSDDAIESENANILRFLAKKSKNAEAPFILYTLFDEFAKKFNSINSSASIQSRFRSQLASGIHEMDAYDVETRVRMLFVSSTAVNAGFLKELRKQAEVKLDNCNRIIKYTSKKRGGLRLEGGHSTAAKRRSSEISDQEESEDSDNDEVVVPKEIGAKKKKCEQTGKKRRLIVFSSDEDNEEEEEERGVSGINTDISPSSPLIDVVTGDMKVDPITPETGMNLNIGLVPDVPETIEAPKAQETPMIIAPSESIPNNSPKTSLSTLQVDQTNTMGMNNILSPTVPNFNNNFSDLSSFGSTQQPNSTSDFMAVAPFSLVSSGNATSSHFDMRSFPMSQFSPYTQQQQSMYSGTPLFSNPTSRAIAATQNYETKRLKEVLKLLKIFVISLESPLLNDLNEQIKQTIEKMGDRDEEVPMKDLHSMLRVSLFGVTRKLRASSDPHPTKNAKEFLKIFKCMLYGLESISLYDLLCKVQQTMDTIESDDQTISISDINQVVQNVLFTLIR